jgi:hypothetical protein
MWRSRRSVEPNLPLEAFMRRFVILAALLGLTACGGEMLPEETQAPASTQEAVPEEVSGAAPCSGGSLTCCAAYSTPATCSSVRGCFWYNNRCQPAYE